MSNTEQRIQLFSQAATQYDTYATAQKIVSRRLADFLPPQATSIVELGCGTGLFTHILSQRYDPSAILAIDIAPGMVTVCQKRFPLAAYVVADAHQFVAPREVDLVASCSSFQWFSAYKQVLDNIWNSLSPTGYCCVSMFIEGSLCELAESYKATLRVPMPTVPFWQEEECCQRFVDAGFRMQLMSIEEIKIPLTDPFSLLKGLKMMGLSRPDLHSPLLPGSLKALIRYYSEQFGPTATYKVFYGLAQKGDLDSRH